MRAAAESCFVETSPKELLVGFRCTLPGLPPYCKELWKSQSDGLFYLYRDGGVVFDEISAEDLPEIMEALRRAARDDSRGESVEEYGPEAYPQPPVGARDGNAAQRPAEEAIQLRGALLRDEPGPQPGDAPQPPAGTPAAPPDNRR